MLSDCSIDFRAVYRAAPGTTLMIRPGSPPLHVAAKAEVNIVHRVGNVSGFPTPRKTGEFYENLASEIRFFRVKKPVFRGFLHKGCRFGIS